MSKLTRLRSIALLGMLLMAACEDCQPTPLPDAGSTCDPALVMTFGGAEDDGAFAVSAAGDRVAMLLGFTGMVAIGNQTVGEDGESRVLGPPQLALVDLIDEPSRPVARAVLGGSAAFRSADLVHLGEDVIVGGTFLYDLDLGAESVDAGPVPHAFVARVSAAGEISWASIIRVLADSAAWDGAALLSIAVHENEVVGTGWLSGRVDLSGDEVDVGDHPNPFIARWDLETGTLLTHRVLPGSSGLSAGTSLAVSPDGAVYVTGFFAGGLVLGLHVLSSEDGQMFVARFTPELDVAEWAVEVQGTPGTGDRPNCCHLVLRSGSEPIVAGRFQGTLTSGDFSISSSGQGDVFILALDAQGRPESLSRVGGEADEDITTMTVVAGGDVVVGGSFRGRINLGADEYTSRGGGRDGFIVRLGGRDLSPRASAATIGESGAIIRAVAVDDERDVWALGTFAGAADVDSETVESLGGDDAFLLRTCLDLGTGP